MGQVTGVAVLRFENATFGFFWYWLVIKLNYWILTKSVFSFSIVFFITQLFGKVWFLNLDRGRGGLVDKPSDFFDRFNNVNLRIFIENLDDSTHPCVYLASVLVDACFQKSNFEAWRILTKQIGLGIQIVKANNMGPVGGKVQWLLVLLEVVVRAYRPFDDFTFLYF